MAWRKDDDADPVGRGCGVPEPPPPKPPPDGGVTPCCSRHLRNEVFCVEPEPEPEPDDPAELELQPATKTTAVSAMALSVVERARDRSITYYLLAVSQTVVMAC
jgi:hypothetical protein